MSWEVKRRKTSRAASPSRAWSWTRKRGKESFEAVIDVIVVLPERFSTCASSCLVAGLRLAWPSPSGAGMFLPREDASAGREGRRLWLTKDRDPRGDRTQNHHSSPDAFRCPAQALRA